MHLVFINYIISDSRDGRYNNLHYKLLLYLHKNGTNQNVTLIAAIYIYIHSVVKRSGTIIIKKKKKMKNIPYFAPSRYLRICCRVVEGFVLYFCYFKYPRGTLTHTQTCSILAVYIIYMCIHSS